MGRMLLLDHIVNNATGQVEGFCIIKSVTERINTKGAPYLDMTLVDSGGEVAGKLWDYDAKTHGSFHADMIVKVRGSINVWHDTEQLRIERIRKYDPNTDTCDMETLVPCAPFDPEWMFSVLVKCAEEFADNKLGQFIVKYLNDRKDRLMHWPAALKLHHAQRGGLLYHTITMLKMGRRVCEIYPALDSDLVYAGVILHDMAKLSELTVSEETGLATSYSVSGQLIGHISMGVSEIGKYAEEFGIGEELTYLLQHMVLTHHGIPEHGSPRPPMFPEAEVVSTLDLMDARLFEMFDALDNTEIGSFTERVWALDNRMLYKHGHQIKNRGE